MRRPETVLVADRRPRAAQRIPPTSDSEGTAKGVACGHPLRVQLQVLAELRLS